MLNLNTIILQNIKQRIPSHILPVHYLMDTLDIDKEPAYRRVRNQVRFTLEESLRIADNLSISIDTLVGRQQTNIADIILPPLLNDSMEASVKMFELALKTLNELHENTKIIAAVNSLPWHYFPCPLLLKHQYYDLVNHSMPFNTPFSKVEVPPHILQLHQQIITGLTKLKEVTCCVDKNIVTKTINEIKFYHSLGVYSREDVEQIQQELFDFLHFMVIVNTTGRTGDYNTGQDYQPIQYKSHLFHIRFHFYISQFPIENNSIYYYGENGEEMLHIWFYPECPFIVKNNPLIIERHKRWLSSKSKYNTLITDTNITELYRIYQDIYDTVKNLLAD
jgi:hypothetical protein